MEQTKKVNWSTVAIVLAVLILAGSIFFTGFTIKTTVDVSVRTLKTEMREEWNKNIQQLRREALSFIYAYRRSALDGRELNSEDLDKGYEFSDKFLSK